MPNPLPQRCYPWGNDFIENNLNCAEDGWWDVSGMGVFPQGATPCGCEEMSGNVCEWTRSQYDAYPYPAGGEALLARESCEGGDSRVLRGGAFSNFSRYVRVASRNNSHPEFCSNYVGFRVVVSPLTLDDDNSER